MHTLAYLFTLLEAMLGNLSIFRRCLVSYNSILDILGPCLVHSGKLVLRQHG